MASNTYDSIPADRIGVLTEEAPLPSPEVLGDESAASCVWSDILKPIASNPLSPVLRYLGTRAYHAATGSELRKTYADGSSTVKTYDAFNRLSTETSARGLVATYAYETQRDLMTGMVYTRGTTTVVQRGYSYDALGRPLTRTQSRQGGTRNDSFTHNDRSELTAATLGTDAYAYAYDNIGNRLTAQEAEEQTAYTANNLNQYTAIQEGEAEAFAPTYDADGNQTLVKTSTGIWTVTYNAANRPVVFANEATGTVVECSYDSSGRRATKKVTVNGTVTLHQRYIYRGYLQIACCDLTRTAHPCLWLITRDPTQPIATRPLAIQKDGTWYTYGWDLAKNVTEVFGSDGYIKTAYTYTPYGAVSASGNVTQPIQWSSEFHDAELGLVYYNYRHYNPADGRWLTSDTLFERFERRFVGNRSIIYFDYLGAVEYRVSYNNSVYFAKSGVSETLGYTIEYNCDKEPRLIESELSGRLISKVTGKDKEVTTFVNGTKVIVKRTFSSRIADIKISPLGKGTEKVESQNPQSGNLYVKVISHNKCSQTRARRSQVRCVYHHWKVKVMLTDVRDITNTINQVIRDGKHFRRVKGKTLSQLASNPEKYHLRIEERTEQEEREVYNSAFYQYITLLCPCNA